MADCIYRYVVRNRNRVVFGSDCYLRKPWCDAWNVSCAGMFFPGINFIFFVAGRNRLVEVPMVSDLLSIKSRYLSRRSER